MVCRKRTVVFHFWTKTAAYELRNIPQTPRRLKLLHYWYIYRRSFDFKKFEWISRNERLNEKNQKKGAKVRKKKYVTVLKALWILDLLELHYSSENVIFLKVKPLKCSFWYFGKEMLYNLAIFCSLFSRIYFIGIAQMRIIRLLSVRTNE